MISSALALGGAFLAGYLTLYHYGYVGALACGTGGCEVVQASKYATFAGLPVALWGTGYYLAIFLVATIGTMGAAAEKRWPTTLLLALNSWGALFSSYLTWAEVARINQFCRYCLVSAAIVVSLLALSLLDWRQRRVPERVQSTGDRSGP